MNKPVKLALIAIGGFAFFAFLAIMAYLGYEVFIKDPEYFMPSPFAPSSTEELTTFTDEEDFKTYILEGQDSDMFGTNMWGMTRAFEGALMEDMTVQPSAPTADESIGLAPEGLGGGEPDRYSETNVQVQGIDEPDMVKTDGTNIYFSPEEYWYLYRNIDMPMIEVLEEEANISIDDEDGDTEPGSTGTAVAEEPDLIPQPLIEPESEGTKIITAFPVDALEETASIDANGQLLLYEDTLMIFRPGEIIAYNVETPATPVKIWDLELDDRTSIAASRLMGDDLYVVTSTWINEGNPCPIEPLLKDTEAALEVRCTDIYHPQSLVPIDSTYTAMKINPDSGEVTDSTSFVGAQGTSIVYMSPDNLYITYTYPGDIADIMIDFFIEQDDLFPSSVTSRLGELKSYDISQASKMTEVEVILETYYQGLSDDEMAKLENDMTDALDDYMGDHQRDLEMTGIAKIDVDTLDFKDVGVVPGHLLNQFSLDEYRGNLRVSTTTGSSWWFWWMPSSESVNDVYVLGPDMKQVGSVLGMGLDESIYSVRFIREAGYVVTFKQIDPFYVLDLSNPTTPVLEGELKIPGYSSYLHPLGEDVILGVGQEDGKVKLSLFDVTNNRNPVEKDKYLLDEYWTDVSNTHHAFLQDAEHGIFFIPGGNKGYVFKYTEESISLEKVVTEITAKRAVYIDDYLYVIGQNKLVVLDENTWERVDKLTFE